MTQLRGRGGLGHLVLRAGRIPTHLRVDPAADMCRADLCAPTSARRASNQARQINVSGHLRDIGDQMDSAELANRFKFHPATVEERRGEHEFVRHHCGVLAELINERVPDGREKSLAMTHLEEVMFWANAAIARQG